MSSFFVPLTIYTLACLMVGVAASKRTIRFWGGVVLSVVITPVLAALILILTRQRSPRPTISAPARP